MSTQEMQNIKLQLIQWIAEIEDNALIDELLEIQIKNKDIPQWQKRKWTEFQKQLMRELFLQDLGKRLKEKSLKRNE
jgi:hypothetical protein